MMAWLVSALNPRRIAGQITLLVIASVVLSQILISVAFFLLLPPPREMDRERRDAELALVVDIVGDVAKGAPSAPASELLAGRYPWLAVSTELPSWATVAVTNDAAAAPILSSRDDVTMYRRDKQTGPRSDFALRFDNGMVLVASGLPDIPPGPPVGARLVVMFGFLAPMLAVMTFWAVTVLTAPLRRFTEAAESFDVNREHKPLREQGPDEIRRAAKAFNSMRDRIKELIDERTQMLLAVSHDLRTPITRLRLRTAFIADETARAQMERDLDQMNAMLRSALSLIRDERNDPALSPIDVASISQTVTDEFVELGHAVSYEGPDRLVCPGRFDDMHRVLTNLVDNAVRYAGSVVIRLRYGDNGGIVLTVEDDGPGIPEACRETVLKPFVRVEDERPMRPGQGFGLGLSIVRSLVRAQGGRLSLHDNTPHGLVVRIDLPQLPAHSSGPGNS
ncbi:ATP-binding protein [Pseudochelatococcus contaminans]|uniref:histidine kinase n=1 Tax=Pseudochelatococcus contaminans TaxID=1538103 RepID=A0A7W5Z3W5_9HYPH|nr:HAMP domain-containing sensor histidine kinase [Pseudochelatococcus contaminans]MBB3809622.1 signal transduction histidine kinase [Pseudochelatococcus contaminans]